MKKAADTGKALVLRLCNEDFTSKNGFKYPNKVGAEVVAPDWKTNADCGNGLHGWLFGHGDHSSCDYFNRPNKWMVIEVELQSVIMLGGKVKFERGIIKHIGEKKSATDFIIKKESRSKASEVIGAVLTVGDSLSVIAGSFGTATAGDRGTATAGSFGTATAGDRGTATAGDSGTATAGSFGTATAGDRGEIRIRYYDNKADRYRTVIGYVGENGIEANVAYKLDSANKFVKATA